MSNGTQADSIAHPNTVKASLVMQKKLNLSKISESGSDRGDGNSQFRTRTQDLIA